MVKPVLPPGVEPLLKVVRKVPQRHGVGWVEDLGTAVRRDSRNRARLREVVRSREATPKGGGAIRAELAVRVPPPGEIHLTDARHDDAQLEEVLKVGGFLPRHHAVFTPVRPSFSQRGRLLRVVAWQRALYPVQSVRLYARHDARIARDGGRLGAIFHRRMANVEVDHPYVPPSPAGQLTARINRTWPRNQSRPLLIKATCHDLNGLVLGLGELLDPQLDRALHAGLHKLLVQQRAEGVVDRPQVWLPVAEV